VVTRRLFLGFIGLLALQRLAELRLSHKNEAWMASNGGVEHEPGTFKIMKLVHFGWFLAMVAEVHALRRPFIPWLAGIALLITAAGQSLRYTAIRALGRRWSVRIFSLPNVPPIQNGIYRHIRHPNYLGVALEILAVPLLHSAYLTSVFGSLANILILSSRIRDEEGALMENCSSANTLNGTPRFIPDLRMRNSSANDTQL
jgi:methyltransferase